MILNQTRSSGVTIFGAIVTNSDRFYSLVCREGNNGLTYLKFLKKLQSEMGEHRFSKAVLVMDKAPSHKLQAVTTFLRESGICVMRLPTASSALNNIEVVWSTLKHHWTRRLFLSSGYIKKEEVIPAINEVIEKHIQGNVEDIANGNQQVWLSVLNGHRV